MARRLKTKPEQLSRLRSAAERALATTWRAPGWSSTSTASTSTKETVKPWLFERVEGQVGSIEEEPDDAELADVGDADPVDVELGVGEGGGDAGELIGFVLGEDGEESDGLHGEWMAVRLGVGLRVRVRAGR